MTNERPGKYWTITWRFVSPIIMLILFCSSIIKSFSHTPTYSAYDPITVRYSLTNLYLPLSKYNIKFSLSFIQTAQVDTEYPAWALFIAFSLVSIALAPTPFIYFVRKFKIWKIEGDIPAAAKCLGSTPSTTYMLKSEPSFNRMVESTASELQTIGINNGSNGTTRNNLDIKGSNGSSRHPPKRN